MRAAIAAFCLSIGLCAQNPALGWQLMPSRSGAPEVQYRLKEEGQGLRLEIRPDDVDPKRWALHLWLGDPRIVEARQKHLSEIRDAIAAAQKLLKDPDHQLDYCQASLYTFLGKAIGARGRFRDFDPYAHVRLRLQATPGGPIERLRQIQLLPAKDKDGSPIFTALIPLQGGADAFDAASTQISALSYGLAYVPANTFGILPGLRDPRMLNLQQSWNLEPFLAPRTRRLRALLGPPDSDQIYMVDYEGFLLGGLGHVDEGACMGVEGRYMAPDVWSPWPRDSEVHLPTASNRLRFSYVKGRGSRLAIQVEHRNDPLLLDLADHLGSQGEEGIQLLDCKDTVDATCVLLKITGYSRPGSPGSYCGGGEEADLIWLKLGPDGRLLKIESFLVESCFESIDAEFDKPEKAPWTWEWDLYRTKTHHALSYDPDHPELGVVEKISPSEED